MTNRKENIAAMRTFATFALCAFALLIASCSDSPTSTITDTGLGVITIEDMQKNAAYRSWYETGYNAYPAAADQAAFSGFVDVIKNSFDPAQHSVVMAVKPNCGCQTTQMWMPRVMKVLDAAGVPHDKVMIYITDARLNGIDDAVKSKYKIEDAPTFIVLKNDQVAGRINVNPPAGTTVEQVLADAFAKP